MARIPYVDPVTLSPKLQEVIARSPYNVVRMTAGASEAVFFGLNAVSRALSLNSPLPRFLREVAILRVGYISKAPYETFQHEAAAKSIGMTEAQISAIRAGGPSMGVLSEVEQAVMDFTDDIVKNVRASDSTLGSVRKHLSDQQLLDLIVVVGSYMMICRLLETTGVDFDSAPIDWDKMRAEHMASTACD
jgi:alkylhydroperoxidase family enzyme